MTSTLGDMTTLIKAVDRQAALEGVSERAGRGLSKGLPGAPGQIG